MERVYLLDAPSSACPECGARLPAISCVQYDRQTFIMYMICVCAQKIIAGFYSGIQIELVDGDSNVEYLRSAEVVDFNDQIFDSVEFCIDLFQ